MASYASQIEAAQRTNQAVRALERAARDRVAEIFQDMILGRIEETEATILMTRVVSSGYRSSAAVGLSHLSLQIGVPRWQPETMDADSLNSEYLASLMLDVIKNMRLYQAARDSETARKQSLSRIAHSAGVAVARGYTDAMVKMATELSELHGFSVQKKWQANFVGNTPCVLCADLHGTVTSINRPFKGDNRLTVYGDLMGPPRHPRCMCWLVILVEGVDNWQETPQDPAEPGVANTQMTTDDVKKMKPSFFLRMVRWLRTFSRRLRGRR